MIRNWRGRARGENLKWEIKADVNTDVNIVNTENIHVCIYQPLHNEVKSVLGIKESYSMGKKA